MHYVYIIYSPTIDKYYVGETENVEVRLHQHNQGFFDNTFSKQASDWVLYLSIECEDRSHARKIELHIKNMKSRKYIESLKSSPAKVDFIIRKCKG